jgi:hypothetical protein
MRLRDWLVGILGVVLLLAGAYDFRAADVVSKIAVSAWVGAALGLLLLGVFISKTLKE